MNVISFCIYGSSEKYCRGLLDNLEIISIKLPNYNVFIYVGNDVPEEYIIKYSLYNFVKLIYTNGIGLNNRIHRFFAIDDPCVNIAIVRDTDSRLHERDLWCIQHFVDSKYAFHTTRDHPHHRTLIMGGLWGIKKGFLKTTVKELYDIYYNNNNNTTHVVQHDQYFLRDIIYPLVWQNIIVYVYNENMKMVQNENIFKIPFKVEDHAFCGYVIEWINGVETKMYKWEDHWNN
jgi:protein O-GlcNAc transferase